MYKHGNSHITGQLWRPGHCHLPAGQPKGTHITTVLAHDAWTPPTSALMKLGTYNVMRGCVAILTFCIVCLLVPHIHNGYSRNACIYQTSLTLHNRNRGSCGTYSHEADSLWDPTRLANESATKTRCRIVASVILSCRQQTIQYCVLL